MYFLIAVLYDYSSKSVSNTPSGVLMVKHTQVKIIIHHGNVILKNHVIIKLG